MLFAYLDEFGHVGPFVHRQDATYKDSPVFGLAGMILPESSIRPFATRFLKLKSHVFSADIASAGKEPYNWEKHGSSIFRPKSLERYEEMRRVGFRLLNIVNDLNGKVFSTVERRLSGALRLTRTVYTTPYSLER